MSGNLTIFAARKNKCGEIWLLATTLKNAKMLTTGHLAMVTAFISMFCVFVTAPHSCGAYFFVSRSGIPETFPLLPGPELSETFPLLPCFRQLRIGKQEQKHRKQGQ